MEAAMEDGRLYLAGDSDAAIVSGLVALLLRVYSGRTPAEILATDPVFLKENGDIARDVMPDCTHPNEKGYEIWAKAIQEPLKKLLQ